MAQLRHSLGLGLPTWRQYLIWLNSFVLWQPSLYRDGLVNVITNVLPATLLVFGSGTILAFLVGQWLG